MKTRSVKFNFIMNFILTASSILFPLITSPYVLRVLQADGIGRVDSASAIMTYFTMFASLGIPTYGIRTCARVKDDKEELSNTVQELMIINTVTMLISYTVFLATVFFLPEFAEEKTLLFINSISMVLNVIGVTWFYNAIEQYAYITCCSVAFKMISIVLMFAIIRSPEDYVKYGAITVFAASASYVLNFINLRKYINLKKTRPYRFRVHLRPIFVFFATSAAISIYTNLDLVMIKFMKGNAEAGYYSTAIKIKNLLVSLITSLGTVLLPRLSYYIKNGDREEFKKIIAKAFSFVLIAGLSVALYFTLMAEDAISLIAGKGYVPSILIMQILMPTVLLIGLSNITGIQMLTPYGEENKVLFSIVCGAVLDFVLNLFLIPEYGAAGAATATVLAELMVLMVQCIFLGKSLKDVLKYIEWKKYLIALFISAICLIFVISKIHAGAFIELVLTAIIFFGSYGGMLLLQKEKLVTEILNMGKNLFKNRRI